MNNSTTEREVLTMYYTQEQIDRANQADLVSFLQSQGEQLTRAGNEYRWKRHDSLTVRGNKWYRHSQSKGGGPVDFVMEFFGKSFTEAVELLTGEKEMCIRDRNQGATNVEIDKESIRDFEKLAKKYGVDFAVRKDKYVDPPRFLVFVRSKDADALDALCKEHQARALTTNEKPSVLAQLKKFKEIVAAIPKKVREKKQERDL